MTKEYTRPQSAPLTEGDLLTLIVAHLAERLRMDARFIDVHEPFSRHGLDSRGAVDLVVDLRTALGRPLSPVVVWQHPTPDALARHLAGGADAREGQARADSAYERPGAPNEPIAIVGMACRFPGAPDVDSYWRLLSGGVDAVTEVPAGRWDMDAFYDRDPRSLGDVSTLRGGFIDDVDRFDAMFFGISPREAVSMDPQQRLMLELAWEALEDAGIVAERLKESLTGVFFGCIWDDYVTLIHQRGRGAIAQHTVTGNHRSIIANRVSYTLDLRGPSMTVDSACSSALVTIHMACESLRSGESTLALAGGVNLNIAPESTIGVHKFGGLSPDGRCFTFDARANGYVRGEGGGVVVLKRLSSAIADGDPIICVIRGSAVNNDGASNGLTGPNPLAQEAVLRTAYERAGVNPADVQYVELHGTGTQLGDPVEASALGAVLGKRRPAERPLLVGSAKTNVGHLEGAAGIVGLLKAALCLKHKQLAPNLNFETPNPHIPFAELNLKVQGALGPWPDMDRPLVCGVSSFGLGGTNAHVVLSEWASLEAELHPLAAESPEALREEVQRRLLTMTSLVGRAPLSFLCGRSAAQRSAKEHRLAVTARSFEELKQRLLGFLEHEKHVSVSAGRVDLGAAPKVVFVFAGQGAQWFGMGRALLQREPVFRTTIEQCSSFIQQNLGWSLLDELMTDRESSRLDEIDVSLPAIISIEIALAAQWRAWGVEPAFVVGHSTGEIAAAHVAGVLSIEDAMRTICAYGRIIRKLRGKGGMGLVALSWEDAGKELTGYEGRLFRAIEHSADSTVLAGEPDALDALLQALERKNVFCRRVAMDVAPHCPQVDCLRDELFDALREVRPNKAQIPIVSEVTGTALDGERFDASHWVRNFGDPALFSTAIDHLLQEGFDIFLELTPHPLALPAIESNLRRSGRRGVVLPSLRRNEDERGVMLDTLGVLYVRGAPVRWDNVYPAAFESMPLPSTAGGGKPLPPMPLLISARTDAALAAQAARLRAHLDSHLDLELVDVAYSLAATRTHFERRAVVVARDRAGILDGLDALAHGGSAALLGRSAAHGKLAILFTGQGSQRPTMGRALYDAFPVFRGALDAAAAHLDRDLDRPLRDVLFAPDGSEQAARLDQTAFTQPALFALEVALFELLQSFGLKPALLLGHSIGELVAAHVAGVLSLQDACTLVAARAKLMQALPQGGAMVTLQASEQEARDLLQAAEGRVSLAAVNGHLSTVVAGDEDAVLKIARQVEALGRKATRLRVSHAFHSPHMDGMLDDFRRVAQGLTFHPARIPIISNVTGARATDQELASPETWVRHVRDTVRFLDGVRTLHAEGARAFLELGPHPVLSALAQDALGHDEGPSPCAFLPTLRKGRDDAEAFTAALGALHAAGLTPDWNAFFAPFAPCKVPLPTYTFQRERFWLDASTAHAASATPAAALEGRFWQAVESGDIDTLSSELHVDGDEQRAALALVLPTLSSFRHKRQEQSTVDAWRYRVTWKPLTTAATPADLAGTWLLVVPSALGDDALLATLTEALTRRGARVLALRVSDIHIGRSALVEHLREALAETAPLRGVLSLLALDEHRLADRSALPAGLALSLALVQGLDDLAIEAPLWLFTRGAVSIGHSDPITHPTQAMIWGLGRVVGLEHPERWGGLVDVSAGVDESAVGRLLPALAQRHDEDQLALRPAGLYARRIVRAPLGDAPPAREFRPRGTILITGGTGALGAHVARWLARQGAEHLILISRRGAEAPGASELHAELNALGVRTTLAACDVADRSALQALLDSIPSDCPLTAVFHTAGARDDGLIGDMTPERIERVLAPKLDSALHLHELTKNSALDAFVLYASLSGVLGNPGQANYAAANAFLDALAEHRRSLGLTATSVAWGGWGGGGMATERVAAQLQQRGLLQMAPSLALAALAQALQQDETTITVADIDWSRFAPAFSVARQRPLLRDLPEAQRALQASEGASSEHGPATGLLDELRSRSESEQLDLLATLVRGETATVLGHAEASHVDPDKGFMDLGLDSLMTVELRRRLQKATGVKLPPTLAFDHPSPHRVAFFLRDSLSEDNLATQPSPTSLEIFATKSSPSGNSARPASVSSRLPGIIFILSSPRSGSTLLRVMLAGHSSLFSPPELHLLPFNTMKERQEQLNLSYLGEGLQKTFMEVKNLDATASQALIKDLESQNLSIQQVYGMLQENIAPRLLVDKSPTYAMEPTILERGEALFANSKYIYLVRHPYSVIESFVRMRMQKLVGLGEENPYRVAEQVWAKSNQNILNFLSQLEPERQHQIRYEDLVKKPQQVLSQLCDFLNVPFEPELLQPYQGDRMTGGVHQKSLSISDPNFLKHNTIDESLADKWKTIQLPYPLKSETQRIASQLSYELPNLVTTPTNQQPQVSTTPSTEQPIMEEKFLEFGGNQICLCSWGSPEHPVVLCIHGILEQGLAWQEVALPLAAQGYRVVAPDLFGHGRSSHLEMVTSYSSLTFLAQIDRVIQELPDQPLLLVGHSMGAMLATAIASVRPKKIKELILVELPLPAEESKKESAVNQLTTCLDYLSSTPQHPIFPDVATAASRLRQAIPSLSEEFSYILAQRITQPNQGGVRWSWDAIIRTRSILGLNNLPGGRSQYLEMLKSIQVPTTLVYGDSSKLNRPEDLQQQKMTMTQAKRVFLSGGHNLHIDAAAALASLILTS
nr:styrene syntase [Styrene synthase expression construct pBbA2c-ss1]